MDLLWNAYVKWSEKNSQLHHTNKYSLTSFDKRLIFVDQLCGFGFEYRCSHLIFRYCACSSQEFLDIHATIVCGFTLKRVHDMTRTYSEMHSTEKYSQHSSLIWTACLNGCRVEYRCSPLSFMSRACFKQGVPWHLGNYSLWIYYVDFGFTLTRVDDTVKPVYSGHLWFLKKVSAITSCPLYRDLRVLGKKKTTWIKMEDFFHTIRVNSLNNIYFKISGDF